MDERIKALWLAALRSGEYEQAKGYLRTSGGFCCLGVLCDVLKDEVGGQWTRGVSDESDDYFNFVTPEGKCYGSLTRDVADLAGLPSLNPKIEHRDWSESSQDSTLAGANDTGNLSFKEIADIIEKEL